MCLKREEIRRGGGGGGKRDRSFVRSFVAPYSSTVVAQYEYSRMK